MSVIVTLDGDDFEIPTTDETDWGDLTDYLVALSTVTGSSNVSIGSPANGLSIAGDILSMALASASSAGAMSASDFTKLAGVTTGATNTPLSVTTPADVGTAAVGTGTTAARADHVHGHGNLAGGAFHAAATSSAAGFMSTGAQTLAGPKTWTDAAVFQSTIDVAGNTYPHTTGTYSLGLVSKGWLNLYFGSAGTQRGAIRDANNVALFSGGEGTINILRSTVSDGAVSVGTAIETQDEYTAAGAKLFSIRNGSTEKVGISKDGDGVFSGALTASAATLGGAAALTQTNPVSGITNKSFTSPTIAGASLSGTLSGGTFTSTTLTAPTINGAAVSGTFTGAVTFAGALTLSSTVNGGTLAGDNSGDVTIGTANGLSISSQALSMGLASSGVAGAMSGAYATKLDGVASGATVDDHKAAVSSGDTTPGYLFAKFVAGSNITLTKNNAGANETITVDAASAGTITAKDEGTTLTTALTSIDFVGGGVTATNTGGAVTVTVPSATSITAKDEGTTLTSNTASFDFVGGGVTATNTGGAVTVTVPSAVTTVGSVSSTPTANALDISGSTITAHYADGTNAGLLSATTQTVGGAKTFSAATTFSSTISATSGGTFGGTFSGATTLSGAITFGSTVSATSGGTLGGTFSGATTFSGAISLSSTLGITGVTTASNHVLIDNNVGNATALPSNTASNFYGLWVGSQAYVTGDNTSSGSTKHGFYFWSNGKRSSSTSNWAQIDTAQPTWKMTMSHGTANDIFDISQARAGSSIVDGSSSLLSAIKITGFSGESRVRINGGGSGGGTPSYNLDVVGNANVSTTFTINGVTVPTISSTSTLTNKTFSGGTFSGTIAGTPTFSGAITFSSTISATSGGTLGGTFSGNTTFSGNNTYSGTTALSGLVTHTSGIKLSTRATTATTVTHATTDGVILASANSGAVTVNLVAASGNTGLTLSVVKTDSSGNAVTLDGSGSETINGATTLALAAQYDRVTIICDGTNWIRIN